MLRKCIDCGGKISPRSKARCQSCCNRVAYRSPEARARMSTMMTAARRDPWFNAALAEAKRCKRLGLER